MNKTSRREISIAILIFILLVGAFFYLEYLRHETLLQQKMTGEIERLFYHLEDYMEDKRDHLSLISNIWRRQPAGEQEELFLEVAQETINLFPTYRFIHFIDKDLFIRYSAPQEQALHLIGRDLFQYEENISLYEKMIEAGSPVLSPILWSSTLEIYSANLWVPIQQGSELLGIVSGDLDLSYVIEEMITETGLSHHPLRVAVTDTEIFRTDERTEFPVALTQDIMDTPWTIEMDMDYRMSLSFVFFSGALLSLLVSFLVYKILLKDRQSEEAEERLAFITEGTDSGTWEWNVQTGETILDQRWAETIGYTLEDLSPISIETWMRHTHPEDLKASNRMLEKHFAGEIDYYDVEYRMKHKNGHWVWVQVRGKVISWTKEGSPHWMFGTHQDITDRKQTEKSLQQQQKKTQKAHQRLLTILDSMEMGINVVDLESCEVLYINEFTKGVHGDVTGGVCWEVFKQGQTGPCESCTNDRLLDDMGEPVGIVKTEEYNERVGRWREYRAIASHWIDGRIVRLEMALDITERKLMEERLRESKERYRTIFDFSPVGIMIEDDRGTILEVNKSMCEISDYREEELEGKSLFETLAKGKYKETARRNIARILAGEDLKFDTESKTGKSEIQYKQIIETRITLPHGDIGILSMHVDITDRKQAEDALIESEKRLNMLLSNALAVVYSYVVSEKEYKVTYVSQSVTDLLGFKPEDFMSNHKLWHSCIHPEDIEEVHSTDQRLINDRYTSLEYRVKDKEGHYHWVHDEQKVYKQTEDELEVVGTLWDLTERKEMEEKIQYQHDFQKVVANISYTFINTHSSLIDEAINNTLHQIGTFFHVDRAYFFQFSSDDMFLSNTHKWNREGIEPVDIVQNLPVTSTPWFINEIRSKDYVFIPDTNAITYEVERRALQRKDIQSLIIIPIKIKERVIGFIGMDAVTDKKIWTDEEITLLKVIGEIISSALSKQQIEQELIHRNQEVEKLNQHLNQEMEKAKQIHNNILPKELPTIKGISFAAYYQPAETLGGDFYEVIQVDKRLVIYLSDISGHGLDGGMINFFVKEAIHSYISLKSDQLSPRSILRHLERQYRQENHPDSLFICIFLAVLDLETMELTYTGAGFQDAPLVCQGNGEQTKLSTKGLFINSLFPMDKRGFKEKRITLTKGSTIFFNTDGLTEQGEPGAFYVDRLPQVFYKNAHLPPEGISQAVVEDFRQFNNGSLQGNDDITFLILQVKPENSRYQLELATDFGELEHLRDKTKEILPDIDEVDVVIGCLYELTANAMEHGNQMDPTKNVLVEFVVFHGYIQVSVEDEGVGFNWLDQVNRPLELEGLTERERGITMAEILCDSLFFNDMGNKVTFVIKTCKGG